MACKPIIGREIRRTCISSLACKFAKLTPLSFHNDAIYAGLLGRQSKHPIIGNTPEENKEEYTKYTYELDENEKPTGIIAKTTSTGTVIDINGDAYDETKTDTRTIGITIE